MNSGLGVTALLCTRNRPRFLEFALRFFASQTFPRKRVIVVDDSDETVPHPGGGVDYVRLHNYTSLGQKLNIAAERSKTLWLWKMDDDDFYARTFLQTMVMSARSTRTVYFLQPFLLFDVASWTLRLSDPDRCSGATLLFSRECWLRHPFRGASAVDAQFLIDHIRECGDGLLGPVRALSQFVQMRHRGHLWNYMPDGEPVSAYLSRCAVSAEPPTVLFPNDVCAFYDDLRRDLITDRSDGQ